MRQCFVICQTCTNPFVKHYNACHGVGICQKQQWDVYSKIMHQEAYLDLAMKDEPIYKAFGLFPNRTLNLLKHITVKGFTFSAFAFLVFL